MLDVAADILLKNRNNIFRVTITSLLDIVPIVRNAPARKVREELLRLDRVKEVVYELTY